jgi:hypothetical protein
VEEFRDGVSACLMDDNNTITQEVDIKTVSNVYLKATDLVNEYGYEQ